MNEHKDELKKTLSENGNFDTEKAKLLTKDAGSWFSRRIKWAARMSWIRAIICITVFEFAGVSFYFSSNTKTLIFYAVLLVLTLTLLGIISVQYLIVSAKAVFAKEIKLLRLECLEHPTDHIRPRIQEPVQINLFLSVFSEGYLSPGEKIAWCIAFLAVTFGTASSTTYYYSKSEVTAPHIETSIKLTSDGAGTEVMKVSYPYFGFVPRTSFTYTTDDENANIRWIDDQGRELPVSVTTSNGKKQYTVQLIEPVYPSNQVCYTQIMKGSTFAVKKDNTWTFWISHAFGDENKETSPPVQLVVGSSLVDIREPAAIFKDTIQLPFGAEVVAEKPKPSMWAIWDGTPARGFRATESRNQVFSYSIEYRLDKVNKEKK